jgi:hypothetical protein
MLTAEELRLKRRKRRRIVIVLVALLLLLVLGFFGGRPGRNAIKAWQARRHAQHAFAFINKEQWNDARREAIAAYQLSSGEPQAIRAVARFLSRTRQPEALDFWKQLRDRNLLNREDRRDEATIALAAGETARADAAVRELTASKPEPADSLLAAELAIQKGAPDDARKSLNQVLNDSRATEHEQFQAALLELTTSQNEAQVNDAWPRLEKLSRGQSAAALDALVVLARRALSSQRSEDSGQSEISSQRSVVGGQSSDTNREPITSDAISRALESHPLAKAPQKLLAFDLLEHVDPTQRETLIARAIERFKNADLGSLTTLATWLNSKGEYQQTLDTVPLDKALQSKDLFLQHLDALGALRRWSEIKQLLGSERFPLDPVVQWMYLARCNTQLGEKTAAENNWQRALEAAGGDPGKLMTLGGYAEKNDLLGIADSAYDAAAAASPKLRVAHLGRLRIAQATRETNKIHGVLADMLRVWPNDAAVQNDEAYLRLLLLGSSSRNDEAPASDELRRGERMTNDEKSGERSAVSGQSSRSEEPITNNPPSQNYGVAGQELITISALAENLVQHEPASLPHRTLLALARLRQNRASDALNVYANIQIAPRTLNPSAIAVHAAVLAANGREEDARTEAAQIKPEQLLPEERELIKDLRQD